MATGKAAWFAPISGKTSSGANRSPLQTSGLSQNIALLPVPEEPNCLLESSKLLPFSARQLVTADPIVQIGLLEPGANGYIRRPELLRENCPELFDPIGLEQRSSYGTLSGTAILILGSLIVAKIPSLTLSIEPDSLQLEGFVVTIFYIS